MCLRSIFIPHRRAAAHDACFQIWHTGRLGVEYRKSNNNSLCESEFSTAFPRIEGGLSRRCQKIITESKHLPFHSEAKDTKGKLEGFLRIFENLRAFAAF